MIAANTVLLFALAGLALLLVPGPVVLFTVARSLEQGRSGGLASVAAAGVGDCCHVLAAAAGLSALLLSSALAFDVVKYAGAAYLIFLGLRTLLARDKRLPGDMLIRPQPLRRIFRQGLAVAVLNPKTALFFLAFLPQFVDPARGAVTLQILLLGALFVSMGVCTNSLYVLLASSASGLLKNNRRAQTGQKYIAGGVYLALGVTTALVGKK